MTKIICIGGGGHFESVYECVKNCSNCNISGFLDNKSSDLFIGSVKVSYLGSDDDIPIYTTKGYQFLITIGQIKSCSKREYIFKKILGLNGLFYTFIDKSAKVSNNLKIGKGTVILSKSIINSGCVIGANCIINTGAIVEHNVTIGDHCHIAPGSIINGNVIIEPGSTIGSGAIINNNIQIAKKTIVGSGAVVIEDTKPNSTYVGVPARLVKND